MGAGQRLGGEGGRVSGCGGGGGMGGGTEKRSSRVERSTEHVAAVSLKDSHEKPAPRSSRARPVGTGRLTHTATLSAPAIVVAPRLYRLARPPAAPRLGICATVNAPESASGWGRGGG